MGDEAEWEEVDALARFPFQDNLGIFREPFICVDVREKHEQC